MHMMTGFKINQPRIAYEIVDDEVIILNLMKGRYYSSDGVGLVIWEMIKKGFSKDDIQRRIQGQFQSQDASIGEAVDHFLHQLQLEEIILPVEAVQSKHIEDFPTKTPFIPPVLEIYDDMQDLLLLDPIHEVDEMGWPRPMKITSDL